jgi:hypothetical protein
MRTILDSINQQFERNHSASIDMLDRFPEGRLFERLPDRRPFGISLIRSAAEVEMAFGGITTRLWDDPFEWTLPEQLSGRAEINAYLSEVRATRIRGLETVADDRELTKLLPAPLELRPIAMICLDALRTSTLVLGTAAEIFRTVVIGADDEPRS